MFDTPIAATKQALKRTLLYQLSREHPTVQRGELAKASVSRLMPHQRLSVAWFLCGDEAAGSSRIHGLNLHAYLRRNGIRSYVISKPRGYVQSLTLDDVLAERIARCRFDVAIFQRVYAGAAPALCRRLNAASTATVFFVADLLGTSLAEAKHTFVASQWLRDELIRRSLDSARVYVVPDAIETDVSMHKDYSKGSDSDDLVRLVWVGAEGHWPTLETLKQVLSHPRFARYRLVTISNHPQADIRWRLDTVWRDIMGCDIGVVPADLSKPESLAKSNNRATMFKALGLPVVCSRVPAYLDVIRDGVDGYFADSADEWASALLQLESASSRMRIGLEGRDQLFGRFSIDVVGARFCNLLCEIANRSKPRFRSSTMA